MEKEVLGSCRNEAKIEFEEEELPVTKGVLDFECVVAYPGELRKKPKKELTSVFTMHGIVRDETIKKLNEKGLGEYPIPIFNPKVGGDGFNWPPE